MVFVLRMITLRIAIALMLGCGIFALAICCYLSIGSLLILDSRLNDHMHSLLNHKLLDAQSNNAYEIRNALNQEQQIIKDVLIQKKGSLKNHIYVYAIDPLYLIEQVGIHKTLAHQKMIVTQDKLVCANCYIPEVVDALPRIFLSKDTSFDEIDLATIFAISPRLLDDYMVEYHDKTKLMLSAKNQHMVLIADEKSIKDESKIKYAEYIAEKKYKNRGVQIDIRFAHGVVCSPTGGGL